MALYFMTFMEEVITLKVEIYCKRYRNSTFDVRMCIIIYTNVYINKKYFMLN